MYFSKQKIKIKKDHWVNTKSKHPCIFFSGTDIVLHKNSMFFFYFFFLLKLYMIFRFGSRPLELFQKRNLSRIAMVTAVICTAEMVIKARSGSNRLHMVPFSLRSLKNVPNQTAWLQPIV